MPRDAGPDATLDEVRERGFSLVEGFLTPDELAAAQEALWLHFPRPEDYFADPERAHARYAGEPVRRRARSSRTARGTSTAWPCTPTSSTRPSATSDTTELHLYKVELWAKYAGAVDYDQPLHRDYGSHSLVVPRPEPRYQQLTTFIYLSDVTEDDGPTRIVPYDDGKDVPYTPLYLPVRVAGRRRGAVHRPGGEPARLPDRHPAPRLGLHRAPVARASRSWSTSRSAARPGAARWRGPSSRPSAGPSSFRSAASAERDLFGFPRPGDPYWDEETLAGRGRPLPGHRPGALPSRG